MHQRNGILFCKVKQGKTPSEEHHTSTGKRSKPKKIFTPRSTTINMIMLYILMTSHVASVSSCSAATTLTASTTVCEKWPKDENFKMCTFNEVTRLALVPQGQQTCLLIKKPDNSPLGTLKLQINRIKMKCNKKSDYFTRDFFMKLVASKRCPQAGSCHGAKCSKFGSQSVIEELKCEAYNYPGFTYCQNSCGCAACKCFLCEDGCLFYRTYAYPKGKSVYEVYSCSLWEFSLDVKIIVEGSSGTVTTHDLTLRPGIKTSWRNFEITLIGIVSPPTPILGTKFLTDGTRTIIVEASAGGQPLSGTIGGFQCANRNVAESFSKCYLPHDVCTCVPQGEKVSCTCANLDIQPLFEDKERILPLKMHGVSIQTTDKSETIAEFHSVASLETQISMTNFSLTYIHEKTICNVTPLEPITGCYSCLSGAKLKIKCNSNSEDAIAHISCGDTSFSTKCTADGHPEMVILNFKQAEIDEPCSVQCPAGQTTFNITGTLMYVNKDQLANIDNIVAGHDSPSDIRLNAPDFGFLSKWFSGHWVKVVLIVLGVIVLVILTIPLFTHIIPLVYKFTHITYKYIMGKCSGILATFAKYKNKFFNVNWPWKWSVFHANKGQTKNL